MKVCLMAAHSLMKVYVAPSYSLMKVYCPVEMQQIVRLSNVTVQDLRSWRRLAHFC